MANIIAIIVTYNPSISELKEQFKVLAPQVDGIIYVDNGSIDFQLPFQIDRKTKVIYNRENLGLGAAQNIGIREAIAGGATHILLLDDDSTPAPDMIQNLLDNEANLLSEGHKLALIGARIMDLHSKGRDLSDGILFSGFKIKHVPIVDRPVSVSYCIASGSLIPINVFKAIGGINENMFIDGLDIEWCLRARSQGYEIFASHNAILGHRLGNGDKDKIKSHSPMREYYILRNSIALVKMKHIPLGFRFRKLSLSILRLCKSVFRGNKAYAISGLQGIYDGFRINFNK